MTRSIRLAQGPPATRIAAVGAYRPARVMTNDEAGAAAGVDDAWIRRRVGIETRHIAAPDETIADMSCAAGGKAIAASGLVPADIGLVIVCTCSSPTPIPNVAAQVATRLGIPDPGAFDLNAACAGFSYALGIASDIVRAGSAHHVLVIGAEKMSNWLDWTDRSTCCLFGDGAGAAVVGPAVGAGADAGPGIGPVAWGSDGTMADVIAIKDRASFLAQHGQAVFRWASSSLRSVAWDACDRAGLGLTDLAAFVPHQANLRLVEAVARSVGAPRALIATDVVNTGNTSSASIPLALAALAERGQVRSGAPVLLLGFGAGFCYAGQVVAMP